MFKTKALISVNGENLILFKLTNSSHLMKPASFQELEDENVETTWL